MRTPTLGALSSLPALDHPELLAPSTARAMTDWLAAAARAAATGPGAGHAAGSQVGVVEIDPVLADTAALTERYGLPLPASGNCVLIAGSRAGQERIAACVVPADRRAEVNTVVRKLLDVRKCSFLPVDRATTESGMEYGGITPIGLPTAWRVLIDARLLAEPVVVLGSGLRRSKVLLAGHLLAGLPRAEVVTGLST